jgi:hypothetical protein
MEIRRKNPRGPSPDGTLPVADVRNLKEMAQHSNTQVDVTTASRPLFPPSYVAEMIFTTTFASPGDPAPPLRVIRFVRAAEVNRRNDVTNRETTSRHTVPGYISYNFLPTRVPAVQGTADYCRQELRAEFSRAMWSYDGPAQEFATGSGIGGQPKLNVDKPGTASTCFPYCMTAEFLIVLYNEQTKDILEVGYSAGSVGFWRADLKTFVRALHLV